MENLPRKYEPCPFCGSDQINDCYVYIRCAKCGAEGPPTNGKLMDGHADYIDRENATKNWNTRK